MAMVVNHNIPALSTYNVINSTSSALQKSINKLSTGLRINSAADDAAGLAISEKMRAQVRGLDQAVANSQDGISMIQTAEGALSETHSILQRMRELSVQAANDTLTQQDRGYIQEEVDQLREEVTRIGNTTQFNKKKLLNGDAAVLWSSDKLSTKAIVNGGLRTIDQFGQKSSAEANYKITIKADPGQGEVQKSDIFRVKHETLSVSEQDTSVSNVSQKNLQANKADGENVEYVVKGSAGTGEAATKLDSHLEDDTKTAMNDLLDGTVTTAGNIEVAITLKSVTENSKAVFHVEGWKMDASGNVAQVNGDVQVAIGASAGATLTAGAATAVSGTAATDLAGLTFKGADLSNASIGDTVIYRSSAAAAANAAGITVTGEDATADTHVYNVNANNVANKDLTLKQLYFDEEGNVQTGEISFHLDQTSADVLKAADPLAKFEVLEVGDVAKSDVRLYDLEKFWDSEGNFMLEDPQTITLTQGDGKQASITLYANDTLDDVREKLNKAIANDLGQGQYIDSSDTTGGDKFVSFVSQGSGSNDSESVEGTFLIRTIVPGEAGRISLSGDEDVINAFSLNTIQKATESNYHVDVVDAHTGESVAKGVEITGNKLIGVIHPNIDVEFDAMTGVTATWNDTSKKFTYTTTSKDTTLHLSDNTTVFQIGANEGEDMGINIGDMRAHALGLDAVNVTNRDSASRSITVIDNAIDKVSMQRSKLGAYQNRLEHTINNLTTASENLTAAESRIRDTDMAKEMMNFSKLQIMLQAGNSMLAQANQLPQNVLSLVR